MRESKRSSCDFLGGFHMGQHNILSRGNESQTNNKLNALICSVNTATKELHPVLKPKRHSNLHEKQENGTALFPCMLSAAGWQPSCEGQRGGSPRQYLIVGLRFVHMFVVAMLCLLCVWLRMF